MNSTELTQTALAELGYHDMAAFENTMIRILPGQIDAILRGYSTHQFSSEEVRDEALQLFGRFADPGILMTYLLEG